MPAVRVNGTWRTVSMLQPLSLLHHQPTCTHHTHTLGSLRHAWTRPPRHTTTMLHMRCLHEYVKQHNRLYYYVLVLVILLQSHTILNLLFMHNCFFIGFKQQFIHIIPASSHIQYPNITIGHSL